MTIKKGWLFSLLLLALIGRSQNFKGVFKIDPLLESTNNPDTTYIVNFWATWCKPCIEELPAFDSLYAANRNTPVKVLLVSLDFKEDVEEKVKPFLLRRNIKAPCILLDEVNGNDFINKVSPKWSGAIPATLLKNGKKTQLIERKMRLIDLEEQIKTLQY